MPNHCSNSVTIEGPVATIREIHSKLTKKDGDQLEFEFEAFIPMPKEIKGVVASTTPYRMFVKGTDTQVFDSEVNVYNRDQIENRYLSEEEKNDLIEKYGACNWYQWYNQTIGTKWGYYDQCIDVDIEGGYIHIYADSAWCPAIEGLTNISLLYPDVTITNHYSEGGAGFLGTHIFKNGNAEEVYAYSGDFYKEKPEEMDEDEWWDLDEEEKLFEEVLNFIDEHGLSVGR